MKYCTKCQAEGLNNHTYTCPDCGSEHLEYETSQDEYEHRRELQRMDEYYDRQVSYKMIIT